MKRVYCFLIAILLLLKSIYPLQAQSTTEGTDFWVTFGQIANVLIDSFTVNEFVFQIRIVGGNVSTSGTIYFTNLGTSIPFDIAAYEIYAYSLDNTEKYAVYNTVSGGTTNFSIRITTENPVSVFAFAKCSSWCDATNILPVTSLNTEYYAISYPPPINYLYDAFTVIATQNNTLLWHNETPVTLDAGEVYYKTSNNITGDHITSNKPVAFFAQNRATSIHGSVANLLFQQLAPVSTWGKTFFVPVTMIGTEYVRIFALQNNTTISQTGGTIIIGTGGQPILTLQAGEFVELEILLNNYGCYISADKPVGVCSFMKSYDGMGSLGASSQVWIPAIEQTAPNILMAPFVHPNLNYHYALVITSTATKNNTKVSIGGAPPVSLSGGVWYDHTGVGKDMSFYELPLTNLSASYVFSNPEGIIVLGYGIYGIAGASASYYYLAGSSMRNLSAAFTANDIPYAEMSGHFFQECEITFASHIEGIHSNPGSLNWYIDDELQPHLTDSLTWTQTFATGTYSIKMTVLFMDGSTQDYEGTLNVQGRWIKIRNVRY